uniref:Sodium/potassium/calcium exchanger 1 n=1 Tax=Oryzias melastigma TaxID=30732 RepID=A0A3B3DXB6_ORYME
MLGRSLSGVLLWTLFLLTMSAQLDYHPETQIGGDFRKAFKREIERMSQDSEPLDRANQWIQGRHDRSSGSESTGIYADPFHTEQSDSSHASGMTTVSPDEGPRFNRFPADVFSVEQRRAGWVILHILGIMYMFVSLIVVCDEFFVPAVGVIMDRLSISDDVAGATVMAAGRSVPSVLFGLVTVFFMDSRVSMGGLVGSGVYSILFVTGMCAGLSRTVLHLTWWPLFRDLSFYLLYFILVVLFFLDNAVMWWESGILMAGYTLYVIFMKFNTQAELAIKSILHKLKPVQTDSPFEAPPKVKENKIIFRQKKKETSPKTDFCISDTDDKNEGLEGGEVRGDSPLSLRWPDTRCQQAAYLLLLPARLPLWITVPDVRNQKSRRFYAVTFLVSILWICVFSYVTHWWTNQMGETAIALRFMGILVTAICHPDLITSVIVTRKGLPNMAVSSNVGSSIFSLTVSFPLPMLLYSLSHGLAPAAVSSEGISCSTLLLVLMLLSAIVCIVSCKRKMNKALGASLVLLYILFVIVGILFSFEIIVCPLF